MKIKTSDFRLRTLQRGSFTLAVILVVATVVVVGLGGCVVHKLQKKVEDFNEKRKQQETNDVENFAAGVLEQYEAQTGDTGAFTLTTITWATQELNLPVTWQVQTSTNLTNWETVLETRDSGDADSIITKAISLNRTEPKRFFRLLSKP